MVSALMSESGQVFFKGRRPVWPRLFLPCCLNLFRSLSRSEACLAKVVFALMPEFVQVFIKVGGLFGQGCFCLDA